MTQESAPSTAPSELKGALWQTSTYSGTNNNCVEHAALPSGCQAVRDTKDRDRGSLILGSPAWHHFLNGLRDGGLK